MHRPLMPIARGALAVVRALAADDTCAGTIERKARKARKGFLLCGLSGLCGLAAAVACSRPARVGADLVITRANIWTGEATQPGATALAIVGDRIVAVGGADEIEHWRGSTTNVINAEGRRVIPGFNDSHVHLVDGGAQLDSVDLKDADSPEELARR